MLSFKRFLIESYRHSLLLEDKRTEFVNRYMKHHREHPLVQQDPEEARRRIAHSLAFGQNPEEHKFITGQLLSGTYKPGEDDPTIQATLGNWRKLTKETRGMQQGKTLADHDHDSVSAIFRASSGETKSSKAKQSAGDLAKYHIGTIDGGEHGPLDVYHIHQDMVPEGKDVEEETVRFQGEEYKQEAEKPYIDFAKAIKRVCPPGSTICVQHSGSFVKNYSKGHGFFLYTNKDGQTVYGHGNNDRGIVRHDNSVVKGQEAQSIKDQTVNLLSGKRKAHYVFMAGLNDKISPDAKLTDEDVDLILDGEDFSDVEKFIKSPHFGPQHIRKALNHKKSRVKEAAMNSPHFGPEHVEEAFNGSNDDLKMDIMGARVAGIPQSPHFSKEHFEKAFSDPNADVRIRSIQTSHFGPEHLDKASKDSNPTIRSASVLSPHSENRHFEAAFIDPDKQVRVAAIMSSHFGPQHMDAALSDKEHIVRMRAVYSPHFGPQHLDRALNDPNEDVVKAAKLAAARFAEGER